MVGGLELRHPDQAAVGVVAPAVERTGEQERIALVVAADLHAPVAARVEEDVQLVPAVAHQQDRLFAHAGLKVIAGLRHLALVADEQPGAREKPLQLFAVDLLVDKDLAADPPRLQVH